MRQHKLIGALCAFFLLTLLGACSDNTDTGLVAEPVRAIKYQVVRQDSNLRTRTLSGHIRARESSQLSFQVSGQVLAVHVDVGDPVQRGQLIAELDVAPYRLELNTMEAELAAARSDFNERQENFHKQQRVFNDGYVSQSDLDRARAEFERAGSIVKLTQSRVELAQRDLENTRLLAPYTGIVNARNIEPFEDVAAAQPVFEIQGNAGFKVALLLPSTLLAAVSRGDEVAVAIPALGLTDLLGVVFERGLRADDRGAYPVTVVLASTEAGVQAGMSAEVRLALASSDNRLLLPDSAFVVDGDGGHTVFRFDPVQSVVRKISVTATLAGVDALEVTEGVSAGDIVCIAGVDFLRDGQQVTLFELQQ